MADERWGQSRQTMGTGRGRGSQHNQGREKRETRRFPLFPLILLWEKTVENITDASTQILVESYCGKTCTEHRRRSQFERMLQILDGGRLVLECLDGGARRDLEWGWSGMGWGGMDEGEGMGKKREKKGHEEQKKR